MGTNGFGAFSSEDPSRVVSSEEPSPGGLFVGTCVVGASVAGASVTGAGVSGGPIIIPCA